LSQFDNALLSHADRTRIISDEHRKALFDDPMMRGVLLDGFACGTWKAERTRGKVTLVIQHFDGLFKEDREARESGCCALWRNPRAPTSSRSGSAGKPRRCTGGAPMFIVL
jgi:hypothetical protein